MYYGYDMRIFGGVMGGGKLWRWQTFLFIVDCVIQ